MNDLARRISAALYERERAIEGSGILGWLTYRMPDGSMHYTVAGSQPLDEPHWVVDGKTAAGYASAHIIHDENESRRQSAAHRTLLELHAPVWENVEWPHAADDSGKNWVCPSCRPAEPTDWRPQAGHAGVLPEGFVPSYVLAPCPSLTALAEACGVEP